jgi:hypothetical protein
MYVMANYDKFCTKKLENFSVKKGPGKQKVVQKSIYKIQVLMI